MNTVIVRIHTGGLGQGQCGRIHPDRDEREQAHGEPAALLSGIRVGRVKILAFTLTGLFAGLAGMRVGYGAIPESLAPYVMRVMPAFCNVSVAATAAALASLDDLPYLEGIVARIVADREALAARLREIPGVEPLPSATNFLLVRLPTEGAPVVRELGERGVYVRSFPNPRGGLTDCLRVSIGNAEENAIFANELEAVLDDARAAR